jgi:RNA polymerase sporulation-specific sigma factor
MCNSIKPEAYFGLVRSISIRFNGRGVETEDLYQIGCVGLLKAINLFDESKNVKFTTFAFNYIVGEIKMFLRNDNSIKISRKLKDNYAKCTKTATEFYQKRGRSPSVEELSYITNIDKYDVIECFEANSKTISLYEETENNNYLIDYLKSEQTDASNEELNFEDLISVLDEKSKLVLRYRILYDKTQKEISELMNLSQVQISRIEKSAKLKLKQMLLSKII